MKTGVTTTLAVLVAAVAISACGSSSSTSSAANASVSTTSSTSSTTSAKSKTKTAKKKTHKTTKSTTTSKTTTSKTTTHKTTTSKTTTTHTTTTSTTTTAAFKGPLQATLTAENHTPKIGVKWSYTVTAKDATGKPLSGTIETEFVYGGAVVGKENPFKHNFTNGSISNKVTFPARAKGVTGLSLQVIVITSIGKKTLDWSVTPTTK